MTSSAGCSARGTGPCREMGLTVWCLVDRKLFGKHRQIYLLSPLCPPPSQRRRRLPSPQEASVTWATPAYSGCIATYWRGWMSQSRQRKRARDPSSRRDGRRRLGRVSSPARARHRRPPQRGPCARGRCRTRERGRTGAREKTPLSQNQETRSGISNSSETVKNVAETLVSTTFVLISERFESPQCVS